MNDERREQLKNRWDEIHRELAELLDGKVQPGDVDLAAREDALHEELDSIEYEMGLEYLEKLRRERSET